MTRRLIILAALLLITALPTTGHADAMLQPTVTVTGDTIHLGDLFSDAGAHAGDPVAPAPRPGTRVTFNAAWLAATAREHHLNWQPGSDFDQASVERAMRTIGADVVTDRILAAIAADTPNSDATVQLDNPGLRFIVPAEASDAMAIDGLNLDPRTGRFSVFVTAPPTGDSAQRQRVNGRVIYQETLAVPSRAMAIGDVFGPDDVTTIKLPRDRVATDAITDAQQLIGKATRRILRAEEIVRVGDVEEPIVVHKGDLVSIELDTEVMQLSAQGKALDDGAMGAAIRVANTQSNRIIDVTVAGPNETVITTNTASPQVAVAR